MLPLWLQFYFRRNNAKKILMFEIIIIRLYKDLDSIIKREGRLITSYFTGAGSYKWGSLIKKFVLVEFVLSPPLR